MAPALINKEINDFYVIRGTKKNMLLNQIESDKKAFPIILGRLKRDLQTKAYNIDATMHGILKIIVAIYFEREKMINENPFMDKRLLYSLHLITVEEVKNFLLDYKKSNKKPAMYNVDLIQLALTELIERRKLMMRTHDEKKLIKLENSPQLHFNFIH